jgi:hypothetical protein
MDVGKLYKMVRILVEQLRQEKAIDKDRMIEIHKLRDKTIVLG